MENQYIIAIAWMSGFILCRWMLLVEHQAEGKEMTHGDKALAVVLSILSFAMILFILIRSWIASVKAYWAKPAKQSAPAKQKNK